MKKRGKILIFHTIIAPYRIDFFNALNEKYDIKVYLTRNNLAGQTFDMQKIEEQLTFKPIYFSALNTDGGKTPKPGALIEEFNPDLVLVSECGIIPLKVIMHKWIKKQSYKIISIIDDSYNMVVEGNHFSIKHRIAEQILIPFFDEIINVEDRVTDYFKEKYSKGIFFPIIRKDDKMRQMYERVIPISEQIICQHNLVGKKVMLYVGRMIALKNIPRIIEIFNSLNLEDAIFVIVGSGPEESHWKQVAGKSKNIIFTGRLEGDSLYAWYNVADVFCLPSWQEAFGAVTNEALLAGCFSLVSNKAGSQSLIQNGINGFTLDPFDDKQIAEHIINAFNKVSGINSNKITLKRNLMPEPFSSAMDRVYNRISTMI